MATPNMFRYIICTSTELPHLAYSKSSTDSWSKSNLPARALALLTPSEREAVLRYRRPCDAALSVGSYLLKHLAIVKACNISWQDSTLSRQPGNGKPYYEPPSDKQGLEFNVSHHGDLVVLIGLSGPKVDVGIDVVKVDMDRHSQRGLHGVDGEKEWEAWLGIYDSVMSETEIQAMMAFKPTQPGLEGRRAKFRLFYAYWGLKEAYIKMTGEALLASWLKELEFRSVQAPSPVDQSIEEGQAAWGETMSNFEIWLKGERVKGVKMELQSFGRDYMIATAVNQHNIPGAAVFPAFEHIDIGRDMLPYGLVS
ncbi:MAG: hypothetical protein MMC33_004460 [Icmadophila ericetorum]|nr:hypothetical protein [Icmadophila ericetorum]